MDIKKYLLENLGLLKKRQNPVKVVHGGKKKKCNRPSRIKKNLEDITSIPPKRNSMGPSVEKPLTYGNCEVCESPYKIHLRDVAAKRTRRLIPLFYCLDCESFTCIQDYVENAQQLADDVLYNLNLLDQKKQDFIHLAEFLGQNSPMLTGKNLADSAYADIGCNLGILVDAVSRVGFNSSIGYDKNCHAIEKGRELFPALDLKDIAFGADGLQHDVITLIDVLEHIPMPSEFMKSILSSILPNGLLFILVPRVDRQQWIYLNESVSDQFDNDNHASPFRDNDVHIVHYSTKGLRQLGERMGLKYIDDFNSSRWPLNGMLFQKLM